MKNIIITAICCFTFLTPLQARADWKDSVRPHLLKFLGEEWTVKLIGQGPEEAIQLPAIPKVVKSTTKLEATCTLPGSKNLAQDQMKKYNYVYVKEVFTSTRNFNPNDNDISNWVNTLNQGATREGVYRAMVLDGTYAGLESQKDNTSDRAAEFAAYFMAKYLDQGVKKEALQTLPFYSLKRIVTERALELVDTICKKPDDLRDWYAVLSGDLASKYNGIWTKELRKNTSSQTHRKWANAVPAQFLKAEVIIKLHKTFNALN